MQLIFDSHNRNYKMEYREGYLRSRHWRNYRQRQFERFHCCVYFWYFLNRIVTQRDVHHLTYERRGHELDDDTVVICRPTHEQVDSKEIPTADLIVAREAYKKAYPKTGN